MLSQLGIRLVLLMYIAVHGQSCLAQPQQFVLDTVTDQVILYASGRSVTSTTDGGTILHLVTDHGNVQWKIDQLGAPVWCKQYGISSQRRARMPDGGVVFCELTGNTTQGDTSHIQFQVVRTDAQGAIVWSKLITMHDTYVTLFNNGWLFIASDDVGHCLITMSDIGGSAYQWFYCLDADGELLWSRNFLFNPNADHVRNICSDGSGGWFLGSYEWGESVFRLGRLNNFGELAWYSSYAVTGPEFWLGDICSMGSQALAVGGYDAIPEDEEYRWFVMRLEINGNLDWFRTSTTTEPKLFRCNVTNTDEVLVSSGQNGVQHYMARLSTTGEVLNSFRKSSLTVDGLDYESGFWDWDLYDSTLAMGNYLTVQADTSVAPSYQPAIWQLPISNLVACGAQANELSSELLPNSTVIVQNQPYSEVEVPITITDTVCTVTSFTPLTVSDYCYYFTGIQPVAQTSRGARVLTTLLVSGEPITITAPAVRCGITVHDAHGRTLYREMLAPNSNELIPTSEWATGLYFVRFQPVVGGSPNVVKVLIE